MNYLAKFLSLDVSTDKIFTFLVLYIQLRQTISQSYQCNFKSSGKTDCRRASLTDNINNCVKEFDTEQQSKNKTAISLMCQQDINIFV